MTRSDEPTLHAIRRVVAGIDAQGRSAVIADEMVAAHGLGSMQIAQLWTASLACAANNRAPLAAATRPFRVEQLAEPAYAMMLAEYAPGQGAHDPGLHHTDTADHFYVIAGEVVLVLESGDVTLRAGDVGIVRGVVHGWRNQGRVPARVVTFVVPATSAIDEDTAAATMQ